MYTSTSHLCDVWCENHLGCTSLNCLLRLLDIIHLFILFIVYLWYYSTSHSRTNSNLRRIFQFSHESLVCIVKHYKLYVFFTWTAQVIAFVTFNYMSSLRRTFWILLDYNVYIKLTYGDTCKWHIWDSFLFFSHSLLLCFFLEYVLFSLYIYYFILYEMLWMLFCFHALRFISFDRLMLRTWHTRLITTKLFAYKWECSSSCYIFYSHLCFLNLIRWNVRGFMIRGE